MNFSADVFVVVAVAQSCNSQVILAGRRRLLPFLLVP